MMPRPFRRVQHLLAPCLLLKQHTVGSNTLWARFRVSWLRVYIPGQLTRQLFLVGFIPNEIADTLEDAWVRGAIGTRRSCRWSLWW
jgi:hypothetical protein